MHTFRAYIFTFVSSEASCFSDFMYLADLGLSIIAIGVCPL